MTIDIQVINDRLSPADRQRIRRSVMKLSSYNDKILSAAVLLKKDNHSSDKGFHCEIRLAIRGNDLFGKSKAGDFIQATDVVIESLRKRLRKKKTVEKTKRREKKIVFRGA